jgi:hypothetical protein
MDVGVRTSWTARPRLAGCSLPHRGGTRRVRDHGRIAGAEHPEALIKRGRPDRQGVGHQPPFLRERLGEYGRPELGLMLAAQAAVVAREVKLPHDPLGRQAEAALV